MQMPSIASDWLHYSSISTLPCDYLSIVPTWLILRECSCYRNMSDLYHLKHMFCRAHCAYIKLYQLGIPLMGYYPEPALGWSDAEEGGFRRDR